MLGMLWRRWHLLCRDTLAQRTDPRRIVRPEIVEKIPLREPVIPILLRDLLRLARLTGAVLHGGEFGERCFAGRCVAGVVKDG